MTVNDHGPMTIYTAHDCLQRAAANLVLAENQLERREHTQGEWTIKPDSAHTRNRIELGAAWCLLAEGLLEGDRP